jgi:hypothetical protein
MRHIVLPLAAALSVLAGAAGPAAQTRPVEPIRYTLRFPAPHTHYVEIEADVPTGRRPEVELMMAVWTPGSYLVREYARHVERVTAALPDGRPLAVAKTRKNRWRIQTQGASSIRVAYRVYGREMSVRTNWIDADMAMLNGAPTFLTLAGDARRPHEVRLELPAAWAASATALAPAPAGPRTTTSPRTSTSSSTPPSSPATRPLTGSRWRARRTSSSTWARRASGTGRPRPATSRPSCAPRPPSGASSLTSATSS